MTETTETRAVVIEMMEIRPLEVGDTDRLDLQDIDGWALDEIDDLSGWEGSAFTILEDGEPVGISGFSLEDGIGTGWLIGSEQLRNHPVFLHRTMKKVLCELLRNSAVKYIYVDVEKQNTVAVRWLERLGFWRRSESATTARYVLEDMKWYYQ